MSDGVTWLRSFLFQLKISGREKIDALTQKTATEIYTELEKLGHSGASSRDKVLEYLEATTWTYFHEAWKLKKDGTWDGTYTEDGSSALCNARVLFPAQCESFALVSGDVVQEWTFIGSLLFSATTITAIGYGNIAPKTTTGRITCIFYSIFGLPLTMICIANIGIWFAKQVPNQREDNSQSGAQLIVAFTFSLGQTHSQETFYVFPEECD